MSKSTAIAFVLAFGALETFCGVYLILAGAPPVYTGIALGTALWCWYAFYKLVGYKVVRYYSKQQEVER